MYEFKKKGIFVLIFVCVKNQIMGDLILNFFKFFLVFFKQFFHELLNKKIFQAGH